MLKYSFFYNNILSSIFLNYFFEFIMKICFSFFFFKNRFNFFKHKKEKEIISSLKNFLLLIKYTFSKNLQIFFLIYSLKISLSLYYFKLNLENLKYILKFFKFFNIINHLVFFNLKLVKKKKYYRKKVLKVLAFFNKCSFIKKVDKNFDYFFF